MNITVAEEIGNFAMSPAEGKKLLPLLEKALNNNVRAHVSFANVKVANAPFFRSIFNPLFEKYNPIAINSQLVIVDLQSNFEKVLDQVKADAQDYYHDNLSR